MEDGPRVYAEQLYRSTFGWPLWFPECPTAQPIAIGDVGYIDDDGAFVRLFNAMSDDPIQSGCIPEDYIPLDIDPLIIDNEKTQYLDNKYVFSSSVSKLNAGVKAKSHIAEASYSFSCRSERGALLVLRDQRLSKSTLRTNHVVPTYMLRNHPKWFSLATTKGLQLERESIILVQGFLKTSDWAIAAFTRKGREYKVDISADIGGMAQGGVHFSLAHESAGSIPTRSGPYRNGSISTSVSTAPTQSPPAEIQLPSSLDQTVFLLRYMIKFRFLFPPKIKAGAGYHHLPDPDADGYGEMGAYVESDAEHIPYFDPLNELLSYILEVTPAADVAVASDSDVFHLIEVYNQGKWPENVPQFFQKYSPAIDVDVDKVATISLRGAIHSAHQRRTSKGRQQARRDTTSTDSLSVRSLLGTTSSLSISSKSELSLDSSPTTPDLPILTLLDKKVNGGAIDAIAVSPASTLVAGGYQDSVVRIWNYENGCLERRLRKHTEGVSSLAFAPDGMSLVSGASDCLVIQWDVSTGNEIRTLHGHSGDVASIVYSSDGTKFATGSSDCTIIIWDSKDGSQLCILGDHFEGIQTIVFSPDDIYIAAVVEESVYLWDWAKKQRVATLDGHEGLISSISYSTDGSKVVTGSEDRTTRVWDTSTGDEIFTFRDQNASVWCTAFSPQGRHVLSGSSDCNVVAYDLSCDQIEATPLRHKSDVTAVLYNSDGRYIISGCSNGTLGVWDAARYTMISSLPAHKDKVRTIVMSPDGHDIISSSDDGAIGVISLVDILRLREYEPAEK